MLPCFRLETRPSIRPTTSAARVISSGGLFGEQQQVPSRVRGCFAQNAAHDVYRHSLRALVGPHHLCLRGHLLAPRSRSAREGSLPGTLSTHASFLRSNVVDRQSRESRIRPPGWFPRRTSTPRIMARRRSASTRVTDLFSTSCLSGYHPAGTL